ALVEREVREGEVRLAGGEVLALAEVHGERTSGAPPRLLEADGRLRRLGDVVVEVVGDSAEVAARGEVDVGVERGCRAELLLVRPADAHALLDAEVGVGGLAAPEPGVGEVERAGEGVALGVAVERADLEAAARPERAAELEVHVVAEGPVPAEVAEVEAEVVLAVGRRQRPAAAAL